MFGNRDTVLPSPRFSCFNTVVVGCFSYLQVETTTMWNVETVNANFTRETSPNKPVFLPSRTRFLPSDPSKYHWARFILLWKPGNSVVIIERSIEHHLFVYSVNIEFTVYIVIWCKTLFKCISNTVANAINRKYAQYTHTAAIVNTCYFE